MSKADKTEYILSVLREKRSWKKFGKDQVTGFFDNGQKKYVFNYQDGKMYGQQLRWWPNGQLSKMENYKDDKWYGTQVFWDPDGWIENIKEYYSNSDLSSSSYWYSSGKIKNFQILKKNQLEGESIHWHENGEISHKSNFKNGKQYGKLLSFDLDGNKTSEEWLDKSGKLFFIPKNASGYYAKNDVDFKCNLGFTKNGKRCVSDKKNIPKKTSIPVNSYPSTSLVGWTCKLGYKKSEGMCVKISTTADADAKLGASFLQPGFIWMNSDKYTYRDISDIAPSVLVECPKIPADCPKQKATIYGYIGDYKEFVSDYDTRFDFFISEGGWEPNLKVMGTSNPELHVIISSYLTDINYELSKEKKLRDHSNYLSKLKKAMKGKGMLKIKGTFELFSQTEDVYFLATSMEVLYSSPEEILAEADRIAKEIGMAKEKAEANAYQTSQKQSSSEKIACVTDYPRGVIPIPNTPYHPLYLPNEDEAYTGSNVCKYPNGQTKEKGSFEDGIEDGKWTFWYKNGQKKEQGKYLRISGYDYTFLDGKWTAWFENGQKKYQLEYDDGKSDGTWIYWRGNGKKSQESEYEDGKRDGEQTIWFENGKKKEVTE